MNEQQSGRGFTKRDWWPTPGNVLFTLLAIAVYGLTQQSWAELGREGSTAVASTINYQGRLVDGNGVAVTEVINLEFEIFDSLEGGTSEWGPELHPAVAVQNGLFQVSLGSSMVITPAVWGDGERYLQVVVNGETLSPREVIHSSPTTLVASLALTVPFNSITEEHLAVSFPKLLGYKSCSSCNEISENISANWTVVKGDNIQDLIEVTVTTTGQPIMVNMTSRFKVPTPAWLWCGVFVYQDSILITRAHLDGDQNLTEFGCSGTYIFDSLPSGTYTFKAMGFSDTTQQVTWAYQRQIAVFEYPLP